MKIKHEIQKVIDDLQIAIEKIQPLANENDQFTLGQYVSYLQIQQILEDILENN